MAYATRAVRGRREHTNVTATAMEEAGQARRTQKYLALVGGALEEVYGRAQQQPQLQLDIRADRYILFSDQHKGTRDGADDFRRCERAYNTALAYYYRMGHTLVILGDAEELWEERPAAVLRSYRHTLGLEAGFHRQGRYLRLWGNHDDEWRYPSSVQRHLAPLYLGPQLAVRESLIFRVTDGPRDLGALFLAHGHQGTLLGDRISLATRLVVRYLWRPLQRLTNLSLSLPSQDWRLRERHNIALYRWAAQRDRLVLIAGHTHRPVFASQTHAAQVKRELDEKLAELEANPGDDALRRDVSLLSAELEWVRAQDCQEPGQEGIVPMRRPCYFNTGCCSFRDGEITGLEIAEGEIRLIRWPDADDRPRPMVLIRASLGDVFAALA